MGVLWMLVSGLIRRRRIGGQPVQLSQIRIYYIIMKSGNNYIMHSTLPSRSYLDTPQDQGLLDIQRVHTTQMALFYTQFPECIFSSFASGEYIFEEANWSISPQLCNPGSPNYAKLV